jgi:hypothetical protein
MVAVTVNSKTAAADTVTLLQLEDSTVTEVMGFLAAGCALLRNAVGSEEQRQKAGFLLEREQHVA